MCRLPSASLSRAKHTCTDSFLLTYMMAPMHEEQIPPPLDRLYLLINDDIEETALREAQIGLKQQTPN